MHCCNPSYFKAFMQGGLECSWQQDKPAVLGDWKGLQAGAVFRLHDEGHPIAHFPLLPRCGKDWHRHLHALLLRVPSKDVTSQLIEACSCITSHIAQDQCVQSRVLGQQLTGFSWCRMPIITCRRRGGRRHIHFCNKEWLVAPDFVLLQLPQHCVLWSVQVGG